mgnify:CR=1 FL=1
MQQKCINYLKKVDANTDLLVKRFSELVELSSSTPKSGEDDDVHPQKGMNINVIATSTLALESNASNIVRLLEELLLITRSMKEQWILQRLPNSVADLEDRYKEQEIGEYGQRNESLEGMIGELMDRITKVDYMGSSA